MKQKIHVRSIIKRENKILLVRRATGRETLRGLYELPGGDIEFGEAPELAMRRLLEDGLGTSIETVQLQDVVSELDAENTNIQHINVVYVSSLLTPTLVLGQDHDKYVWKSMQEIQLNAVTSLTALVLGVTQFGGSIEVAAHSTGQSDAKNATTAKGIIYSDGGSRGNPGPSASGFIIMNEREEVIYEGGKYLGITTNNQAEYQAVVFALEQAAKLGMRDIEFRMDSLLVVNQMSGVYKIKNQDLIPIHRRITELTKQFDRVHFVHVRREFNRLADGMVNKILDAEMAI